MSLFYPFSHPSQHIPLAMQLSVAAVALSLSLSLSVSAAVSVSSDNSAALFVSKLFVAFN